MDETTTSVPTAGINLHILDFMCLPPRPGIAGFNPS
jgi:hypothetical protein